MSDRENLARWRRSIAESLVDSGLAPQGARLPEISLATLWGEDLLPLLVKMWDEVPLESACHRASRGVVSWLCAERDRSAKLTLGISGTDPHAVTRRLGLRLAWWPSGWVRGNRVGIVSSRLGRKLDSKESWFAVLRATCAKMDADRDVLVVTADTAATPFVERAAQLFGLRVLDVKVPDREGIAFAAWVKQIMKARSQAGDGRLPRCVLSPCVAGQEPEHVVADAVRDAPLRDRVLIALSDRLFVLHVRKGGWVLRLVEDRIVDPTWAPASLYIALGEQLVDRAVADRLMDAGAVGWIVSSASMSEETSSPVEPRCNSMPAIAVSGREAAPIVPIPSPEEWQYLVHCTRRQNGRWPDQSEKEYLSDLILHRDDIDRSAMAALERIVRTHRLLASGTGIRGGSRVVSFTAVPLGDLHRLRVFRNHRGRWDFEPYGFCIDRQWLEQHGTKPVQYGDDATWSAMDDAQRPFFQVERSAPRTDGPSIDWTVEREWRHLGDVELIDVPATKVIVFVPSQAEAEQLAKISPWPVAVASRIPAS